MGAEKVWNDILAAKTGVLVCTGILAIAVLLALLLNDICRARKARNPWVPGRTLLINALCLTLLGLLPRPFQNLLDGARDNASDDSLESQNVALTAFSIEVIESGQRVLMCVFMGYILPTVGNIRRVFSGDMLALVISLGSNFYDVFMELYVQFLNPEDCEQYYHRYVLPLYIYVLNPDYHYVPDPHPYQECLLYLKLRRVINKTVIKDSLIIVSMIYLLLLLGCAVLASIAIQDIANLKLCKLIRNRVMKLGNPSQFVNWQQWRCQMLGLCTMARTFQPSYVLARSILASSTFFAVTISCSSYFAGIRKGILFFFHLSEFKNLQLPLSVKTMFMVWLSIQSLFILCGWCVICQRWMHSMIFCAERLHQRSLHLSQLFKIERYWVRAAQEIQRGCKVQVLEDYKDFRRLRKVFRALKLHKLFTAALAFQFFLVWSSKVCYLFSKLLLHPKFVVRVIMGSHAFHEFCRLAEQHLGPDQIEEFYMLKDHLLILDGESSLAAWVANLSFIDRMRIRLEEAKAKGKKCLEMKTLLSKVGAASIENSCLIAEGYVEPLLDGNVKTKFDLQYLSVKMAVVCLLGIMFEVFTVYETVILKSSEEGVEVESNVQNQKDLLEKCIQAVEQAWEILSFSDNSTVETRRLSNTADVVFKEIRKTRGIFRWLNHYLPISQTESVRVVIQNLKSMAEEEVEKSCHNEFDCMNWNRAVAGAHMQSICNAILRDQATELEQAAQTNDILKTLERSLASIVKHGLLKTIDTFSQFLKNCNDCSSLNESEICKMCSAMAMVFGIVEE